MKTETMPSATASAPHANGGSNGAAVVKPLDVPRKAHPLDLGRAAYSYVERANPAIQSLYGQHFAGKKGASKAPRILDIGCGCGANDREFKKQTPQAHIVGIEPNPRAAELSRVTCDEVFEGMLEDWLKKGDRKPFDLVVLSDVLEHIADPVTFLRALSAAPALRDAQWIISVPNYGVWYNRLRTLLGMQSYSWSGIWDRTHLRFFTRSSIRELLRYCGFELLDQSSTPAIVQSAAPLIRKAFERNVSEGDHLALADSKAFALYQKLVEPVESLVCNTWPELLALQIVHLAKLR
jgi:SAM-dependent methyltransferase